MQWCTVEKVNTPFSSKDGMDPSSRNYFSWAFCKSAHQFLIMSHYHTFNSAAGFTFIYTDPAALKCDFKTLKTLI